MPFSNNSGGPWGGGGRDRNSGGGGNRGPWGGGGGSGGGGGGGDQGPDMDELLRQGRDRLKVIFGGQNGGGGGGRGGGSGLPEGIGRGGYVIAAIALLGAWLAASLYTVDTSEQSVELRLGEFASIGEEGLNIAPWPIYTYEVLPVTRENVINIGQNTPRTGASRQADAGLILTGDENIVDVDYQVVWNISDPAKYLFNLAEPEATIRAVSEAAMREVIGKSELSPILNRDRAIVSQDVQALIQSTLDSYESGVNIVRVNFDKADPPREVIDAFRDVQAAGQDRVRSENQAEAYANRALAEARGQSAQLVQEAEAYAAQTVNDARGDAARFESIYEAYSGAKDVTRKRMYLETMEKVLGDLDKLIVSDGIAGGEGGQGIVPYLPLDQLQRGQAGGTK
ncbi:FtsH protease activity modulator HflK [Albimonas sp. CAU 1670]|uniref:FtsH protease activity modulator HflK n=1 Tax=Albimonas sp. CAU 1670 TaxID=3032599 RepID=UPI0023DCB2A8|nr:FtsH protease activity modulator HflK [Albimonas sp. CAU 1670]MDF2232929.1 FtsH protease activity modulator HflK [Albimonas sp. CAU 1670]